MRFIFHAISVDLDSITTLSTNIVQMLGDSYFLVIRETLIYLIKLIYSGLVDQNDPRKCYLVLWVFG